MKLPGMPDLNLPDCQGLVNEAQALLSNINSQFSGIGYWAGRFVEAHEAQAAALQQIADK